MWLGFCAVEPVLSPKFQAQLVGLPVEVSVNCTVLAGLATWEELNDAVGAEPLLQQALRTNTA